MSASKKNFCLIRILMKFFNCYFLGAIRELLKCDEDILECVKTFYMFNPTSNQNRKKFDLNGTDKQI
jgi:hypothetical protein